MVSYQGFDDFGFLCSGITASITEIRDANRKWFALAEDTNRALVRAAHAAMGAVHDTSMSPKAIAVRILLRACGILEAIILLTERGMVAEGRTLARSLTECGFCIAAVSENPDKFVEMLKKDSDTSRANQAKFIIAKDLVEDGPGKEQLKTLVDEIDKAAIMSPKQLAAMGPLSKQYLYYQRLSDDSAHTSARSLHRHLWVEPKDRNWSYKWAAGDSAENAATLNHAVMAALAVGVGLTQLVELKSFNAEFGELVKRFEVMPVVDVV